MTVFYSCDAEDVDPITGQCAAPYWADPPGPFPPLAVADAHTLGLAFALIVCTAWGLRHIRVYISGKSA